MKVGLYFGTFNPIHVGHLVIANYMAQLQELDQVWLVVSPQNPLKAKESLLADFQRLNLVRIAIDDNPKLRVSDIEFSLPIPSYTVSTLTYLKEKYPTYVFSLIMGEDNLRSLHRWYNYEYILNNHEIYVYPRVETEAAAPAGGQERTMPKTEIKQDIQEHSSVKYCRETPVMNISSSFIRKQISEGKDVRYLLTDPVFQYVDEMHLYKTKK